MPFIHQLLAQYWGYTAFRPLQEDIIRSVMEGHDTLALLPTGGGKSVCFQVPALAMEGLCLVISPLIALMKDQEAQLRAKGIRAVALVSGMKKSEVALALNNCRYGQYKFLYLSPERLLSPAFLQELQDLPLNMIAVDEAHCISQWGYDFRPPYLQIAAIRVFFPDVPVLALTASATPEVREDIMTRLAFRTRKVFAKSFARENISYIVRPTDDKFRHLLKVLNAVPGTAIVYVRNRRKTQEIAYALSQHKISADFYHAGLDHQTRLERQERWMNSRTRVIVATNAFGMGIDKPDVRSVIHLDLPDDLESYYQEAGRAGRDGKNAWAVVLYDDADLAELDLRCTTQFPERTAIRRVYQALCNYLQVPAGAGMGVNHPFELLTFCRQYQLEPVNTLHCLRVLELAGYLAVSDDIFLPARLRILLRNMDLYRFQVEQPVYDPLIKAVLRSYTGLFDDYVRISETELARRLQVPVDTVEKLLHALHKREVLEYHPASDKPAVTFLQPRVLEKDLYIPGEMLEARKERYQLRSAAFRNFLVNTHQCRSILLLSYFGEQQLSRCGTCDYCRERNKVPVNDVEMETLLLRLQKLLAIRPLPPDAIPPHFPGIPADTLEAAIRWLLDNGELITDLTGRIAAPAAE